MVAVAVICRRSQKQIDNDFYDRSDQTQKGGQEKHNEQREECQHLRAIPVIPVIPIVGIVSLPVTIPAEKRRKKVCNSVYWNPIEIKLKIIIPREKIILIYRITLPNPLLLLALF